TEPQMRLFLRFSRADGRSGPPHLGTNRQSAKLLRPHRQARTRLCSLRASVGHTSDTPAYARVRALGAEDPSPGVLKRTGASADPRPPPPWSTPRRRRVNLLWERSLHRAGDAGDPPRERTLTIDQGIAPLIRQLWLADIETRQSCHENPARLCLD